MAWGRGQKIFLFKISACVYPIVPAPFRLCFLWWIASAPLSKTVKLACVGLLTDSLICSTNLFPVLLPVTPCLDYCSFYNQSWNQTVLVFQDCCSFSKMFWLLWGLWISIWSKKKKSTCHFLAKGCSGAGWHCTESERVFWWLLNTFSAGRGKFMFFLCSVLIWKITLNDFQMLNHPFIPDPYLALMYLLPLYIVNQGNAGSEHELGSISSS